MKPEMLHKAIITFADCQYNNAQPGAVAKNLNTADSLYGAMITLKQLFVQHSDQIGLFILAHQLLNSAHALNNLAYVLPARERGAQIDEQLLKKYELESLKTLPSVIEDSFKVTDSLAALPEVQSLREMLIRIKRDYNRAIGKELGGIDRAG